MAMSFLQRFLCAALLATVSLAGARADDVVNGQGLLWKVERTGAPATYVFGTMHSPDPRIVALPKAVTRALAEADTLVLELRTTGKDGAAAAQALFQAMPLGDGRKLPDILGKETFDAVAEALEVLGLPAAILEGIKPWGAYLLLMAPRPPKGGEGESEGGPVQVLDQVLEANALDQGMTVAVLETVQDQIAVFSDMAEADMVELVRQIVADAETEGVDAYVGAYFESVTERYLAGDIAGILALSREQLPSSDEDLNARLMQRLIDDRNRRFATRLKDTLPAGGAFVAVGALHLPGEAGLIALLRADGYRISLVEGPR
jgi:hypothetical protein